MKFLLLVFLLPSICFGADDWIDLDARCLALNVYHEAKYEEIKGQIAVAQVPLHRAIHRNRNLCQIIFKRKQFSWANTALYRGKLLPNYIPNRRDIRWILAQEIAKGVVANIYPDFTGGAEFYHAVYVHPKWADNMKRTAVIGTHIFYKDEQ